MLIAIPTHVQLAIPSVSAASPARQVAAAAPAPASPPAAAAIMAQAVQAIEALARAVEEDEEEGEVAGVVAEVAAELSQHELVTAEVVEAEVVVPAAAEPAHSTTPATSFQYADEAGKQVVVSVAEKSDVITFTFNTSPSTTAAQHEQDGEDAAAAIATAAALDMSFTDISVVMDSGAVTHPDMSPAWVGAGGFPFIRRPAIAMASVVGGDAGSAGKPRSVRVADRPAASSSAPSDVDSSDYARDVVNLSVELDNDVEVGCCVRGCACVYTCTRLHL